MRDVSYDNSAEEGTEKYEERVEGSEEGEEEVEESEDDAAFQAKTEDTEAAEELNDSNLLPYVTNPPSDEVMKEIVKLLSNDFSKPFVYIVRCQLERVKAGVNKLQLCPRELLMLICRHGAVKCATALLEGETGIAMELNDPFLSGFYPLHDAARNLCGGLVELFLQHGDRPSLCCNDDTMIFHNMDPLTVALGAITNHQYFYD